jgi:hypothetical protein
MYPFTEIRVSRNVCAGFLPAGVIASKGIQ